MTAAWAWSSDQAPLASTRIRPSAPRASRTAATRDRSSVSDWPASATLTLAVRQPAARARAYACSGPTAGMVLFTAISLAPGRGPALVGGLVGGPQPAHQLAARVVEERAPLGPAGGPRHTMPCRWISPRNRVGTAIAYVCGSVEHLHILRTVNLRPAAE